MIPPEWGVGFHAEPPTKVWLLDPNEKPFAMYAFVFGDWAIHRTTIKATDSRATNPDAWSLSHVPTGLSMSDFVAELSFWDALNIARALEDADVEATIGVDFDTICLLESVIGAALQEHYVWPLGAPEQD